ncbi:acetyl-CoA C-acyltransferase family protein [Aspergillus niger]|uniref:Acetyl-CoA C-acyltransferase family protein n=1 Tax=Aspergillus niger TaxID=5061 RepID=A0A505HXI2_ASPNG|nr:acetyl-CoA C-acyltransferase family protein [Aspergillus niger]
MSPPHPPPPPAHGSAFESAIKVTPLSSHRYSAHLRDEWCIGAVPHGGYTTSILYRLALVHFAHTHPALYKNSPATPIAMQLSFLRRTATGPAVLKVQDTKLGRRTTEDEDLEVKVAGYITVSPADAEEGLSATTGWKISSPAPAAGSNGDGSVNLGALGRTGRDGAWGKFEPEHSKFRKATGQTEFYVPVELSEKERKERKMNAEQWARFRPGGDVNARWTNEALVYLTDMFPTALAGFDDAAEEAAVGGGKGLFWFPTVTLNIDLKTRLPEEGVEWLYSRVYTKKVRDGRTDLDVTVVDDKGDVVALSTQVGLVLSASRNIGSRAKL